MSSPLPPTNSTASAPQDSSTGGDPSSDGIGWFMSWRRIYATVLGLFILWVALLAALTKTFS